MRTLVLVIAAGFLLNEWAGVRNQVQSAELWKLQPVIESVSTVSTTTTTTHVDFDTQIKPIFQSKCMPCHFSGGQMYDRLPFDRPETIRKLGTKLFTRIKDENHRRLLSDFLAQP